MPRSSEISTDYKPSVRIIGENTDRGHCIDVAEGSVYERVPPGIYSQYRTEHGLSERKVEYNWESGHYFSLISERDSELTARPKELTFKTPIDPPKRPLVIEASPELTKQLEVIELLRVVKRKSRAEATGQTAETGETEESRVKGVKREEHVLYYGEDLIWRDEDGKETRIEAPENGRLIITPAYFKRYPATSIRSGPKLEPQWPIGPLATIQFRHGLQETDEHGRVTTENAFTLGPESDFTQVRYQNGKFEKLTTDSEMASAVGGLNLSNEALDGDEEMELN
jgi:hypothetical protein